LIPFPDAGRERPGALLGGRDWTIAAMMLTLAAAVAFLPTATVLVQQWMTNDTYSFGVLVPPISAYFVWVQRKRLQQLPVLPEPLIGLGLIAICSALLVTGRVVNVVGIQEVAMVAVVPATIWLLLGRRFVWALWFPLSYLLLMLPIWEILTDRFHYQFQLFSAWLSERLLGVIGVPVHRHDNYLELPNVTLEVASVCSGVNFLIAVIAIGVPQAYLFLRGFVPRALVIGFAVAIAIFSNGIRIAIIGGLSYYKLSDSIHGPGHVLQGLFVSAAGIVALQVAIGLMSRRYPRPSRETNDEAGSQPRPITMRGSIGLNAFAAAAAMLVAAIAQPQALVASSLSTTVTPTMHASWRLIEPDSPVGFVHGGPGTNTGRRLEIGGQSVVMYSGNLMFTEPSGVLGYRRVDVPTRTAVSETPIVTNRGPVFVNSVSLQKGDQNTEVVYWYDLHGGTTSQVTTAKLAGLWSLVRGSRPLPQLIVISRTQSLAAARGGEPLAAVISEIVNVTQTNAIVNTSTPQ
jgi:exosortase